SVCRYCLNLQYISLCYLQLLYSLRNIYYFATLYSFFLYFHIIHYINIKKHQLNELSMVLFKIIFLIEIACLKRNRRNYSSSFSSSSSSLSSPTTSGSSVSDSPSIASISSSVGSSVGGTTVTTDSSGSFSIVKSPETLMSATE